MIVILLATVTVGFLAGFGAFKIFFRDRADLAECAKSFILLGPFSFLREDFLERQWKAARLVVYLATVVAVSAGTYYALSFLYHAFIFLFAQFLS